MKLVLFFKIVFLIGLVEKYVYSKIVKGLVYLFKGKINGRIVLFCYFVWLLNVIYFKFS